MAVVTDGNTVRYGNAYGTYTGTAAPKMPVHQHVIGADTIAVPRQRTRKKQDRMTIGEIMFVLLLVGAFMTVAVWFLSVQSSITSTRNDIEKKATLLQELTADNDAKEVYLNKSIDLTEIYNTATTELGMIYPSYDQIVYYQREDGGYVRQYDEIPQY